MTSSSLSSPSRRILKGIAALLAIGFVAGCSSTTGGLPGASMAPHAVYGSDGHYGGWGTGFGSDGSRGRG